MTRSTVLVLRTLGLAMLIGGWLLGGCTEPTPPQAGSVQVKGSETMQPLVALCAEDFMARRPHIDVMVQGGGSGTGIAALLNGTVDVCMASRDLSDKEREYSTRNGFHIRAFDVALDGIAVVVHPHNPLERLDLDQLRHQTLLVYDYAVALPHGSPLRESLNRALLRVIHHPAWKQTVQRYLWVEE